MNQKNARHLRRATLALALGMCVASTAYAQSSITGNIFGQANAGQTITVQNLDTGSTRTVTVDKNGRYRAADLPNGRYKVTVKEGDKIVGVREDVSVVIASGTEVSFASADVQQLDGVTVVGASMPMVDISQTDTRSVFTAEQIQQIAVGRDIASVALLAPSVTYNASYTANGNTIPSFGGAASSENAYYINGYAVTNPLTNLGSTTLPFDAIDQQQVLTGGYGAEFGRSTGGVINLVTKRGTNEWKGGIYTIWSPEGLRASPRNAFYPNTGFYGPDNPDPTKRTDGTLYQDRSKNNSWNNTTGVYVGGPIVKDKLFIYADVEMTKREGAGVAATTASSKTATNAYQEYGYEYPRWATKIDWNITDNHLVEFTGISDVTEYESQGYTFDYDTMTAGNVQNAGSYTKDDSKLYIGKYTGYLTDNLTVSALYGQQSIDHTNSPWGYDPACPRTSSSATSRVPGIPAANYTGCWTAGTVTVPGAYDDTKGWRLDVSYRLGNHDIRVGLDNQEAESYTGSEYGGGFVWVYSRSNNPNGAIDASHGVIGSPAQAGGYGTDGYYVRKQYYTQVAKVRTEQSAQFIEDRWQVTDNFLLSLGLRNETFKNFTGSDEVYVKQDNQWAPRIGAVWDVNGDSSLKLFANAGRYYLALPNNVAVRAAAGSLYTMEYFTYTGVAADGTPTGLTNITVDPSLGYSCPGNPNAISSNLECGEAPDPRTVAAVGLKSHYQDEYIFGMEQSLGDKLSWGAKFTYRDLKSAIDDTCTPALGGGCFIFNPGESNSFYEDHGNGLELVHYTADELDLPKLKRRYYALDLFLERGFDNGFYGKVMYTFSRNYGNTEGQLASDLDTGSGGQTDVSVTQDWDLPQLMIGADGLLPNHRAHQLKAFGSYTFNEEWRVGGSLIVASGRPRNCTSYYPTADAGLYNGSYYWYCGLAGSGTTPGSTGYVAPSADYAFSPRGSHGETPWTFTLNLSAAYTPKWAEGLTLQADVMNVLNRQVAGSYNSRYSTDRYTVNQFYNQELSYSSPRQVRLTARYDF